MSKENAGVQESRAFRYWAIAGKGGRGNWYLFEDTLALTKRGAVIHYKRPLGDNGDAAYADALKRGRIRVCIVTVTIEGFKP